MPLDALCLSGLVHELDQAVTGGKVDKIYQPGRDEVILAVRSPKQGNVKLLLSTNPTHPRPQLTALSRENPDVPPMFCMLLRKHLSGARLLAVEQVPLERVVIFTLEALNELGDRVERKLVLEAIGRRSNLILLDGDGRILDCMRRVESNLGSGDSRQRTLLPGTPKADEAALIDRANGTVRLIEKKFTMDDKKGYYLSTRVFGCTEALQEKAKLKAVCETAVAAVKEAYPEPEELDDVPPFDGGTETAVELLVRNQAVDNRISVEDVRERIRENFPLAAPRFEQALAETGVQQDDRVTVTPARSKSWRAAASRPSPASRSRSPQNCAAVMTLLSLSIQPPAG